MAEDAERRQLDALWDVQLGRMEDENRATETRRFRYIFVAAVLAVVVGVIAAWPVVRDMAK